jgi:hypothetical protein
MWKHALRSSAQEESKFTFNAPIDKKKMNASKVNETPSRLTKYSR